MRAGRSWSTAVRGPAAPARLRRRSRSSASITLPRRQRATHRGAPQSDSGRWRQCVHPAVPREGGRGLLGR
eukprot:10313817-Alexandrium_andersonii.AAC.1